MSASPETSVLGRPAELRRALWLLGVWMLAVVGSMACGLREEGANPQNSEDGGPRLPGIHALQPSQFAQQHEMTIAAGQGFVPMGIELEPGMPLRVDVVSRGKQSPWGRSDRRAGVQAPAPLRAQGAVILRLGATTIVSGGRALLRVSERVRPEIAVNSSVSVPELNFDVKMAWGEPTTAYDPQLDDFGLALGRGQEPSLLRGRDMAGDHFLSSLIPGARVWVQPSVTQAPEQGPRTQGEANRWVTTTSDGRVAAVQGALGLSVDVGGELKFRASGAGDNRPPRLEVFAPLGTRPQLIPMQAMDRVEVQKLSVEPRKFIKMPLSVQAGDLVRVELRGENRLEPRSGAPVQNIGAQGGLREAPLAMRNGDRGWLVPGGRERGVYLRIGESVLELVGNDAFYAPEDGQVEVGVNQCFDGGDWPAYTQCRRRLEPWSLDLRVVVGVSSSN